MRYISLCSYSHQKSPNVLKEAIIFCKLSILLLVIAFVLIILATVSRYSFLMSFGKKPIDSTLIAHNSSLVSSGEETAEGDNETLISLNRVKDASSDSVRRPLFEEYYGIVSLVTAIVVLLGSLVCSVVAYRIYKRYQESCIVSYETINRRFDHQRQNEMAKRYIQEPIIYFNRANSSKVFIDKKRSNKAQKNQNLDPKVSAWAKSKLKPSSRLRASDMTI